MVASQKKVLRRHSLHVCIANLLMTAAALSKSVQVDKDGVKKAEFLVFEMLGNRNGEDLSGNSTGLQFRIAQGRRRDIQLLRGHPHHSPISMLV